MENQELIQEIQNEPPKKAQKKDNSQELLDRLEQLESLVIRMAHNSGTSHNLILQHGLQPYNPTKNDMSKFKRA